MGFNGNWEIGGGGGGNTFCGLKDIYKCVCVCVYTYVFMYVFIFVN